MTSKVRIVLCGCGAALSLLLSGCIAPDIDVVGALGLTVTEDGRPVLVVEPCDSSAVMVTLHLSRQGVAPEETNPEVARWTAEPVAAGQTRIVLDEVADPWAGPDVTLEPGEGYIAGGASSVVKQVLSQVAWSEDAVSTFSPGTVYINDADPGSGAMQGIPEAEFAARVCSR